MFGECADLRDVSEILAIGRVMPKRAIRRHPRRERAGADVADVFHARCAPPTLPGYRHERRHHVAAGGELGYPVTDLDDDAGALVAADGGRHRRQPERAENVLGRGHQALPNVFIGVAQPRGNELQEHLAGARRSRSMSSTDHGAPYSCSTAARVRISRQESRCVDRLFEDRFLVGASVVRVASRPRVETPGTEDTAL